MTPSKPERNIGLDLLRVIACYMVIQIHTGEFYYIGEAGKVLNTVDAHWVGWYNSLCRICVPLFVMISGFFLFPVNDTSTFFKKRFSRVAIPFIIWCTADFFVGFLQVTEKSLARPVIVRARLGQHNLPRRSLK